MSFHEFNMTLVIDVIFQANNNLLGIIAFNLKFGKQTPRVYVLCMACSRRIVFVYHCTHYTLQFALQPITPKPCKQVFQFYFALSFYMKLFSKVL